MKIALLTQTPSSNYGGILQAVALYSYLVDRGHEVTLLDKKMYTPFYKKILTRILEAIPFQNFRNKRGDALKANFLRPFIDAHFPLRSKKIITLQDFRQSVIEGRYSALIVGSDQVWRYKYINDGHHSIFFLDVKVDFEMKKIAYGASFGVDEWEASEKIHQVSPLLMDFDYISTRESRGVDICEETFGIYGAKAVLDPTLLIGAGFYNKFLDGFSGGDEKLSLVTYILDKNEKKKSVVSLVGRSFDEDGLCWAQVDLNKKRSGRFYSVERWLWEIKHASFVVTDSFHGMVFSILFQKQFIVVGNSNRGTSRFESLLEMLGLRSRLLLQSSDIGALLAESINYEEVGRRLDCLRRESELFLLEALS